MGAEFSQQLEKELQQEQQRRQQQQQRQQQQPQPQPKPQLQSQPQPQLQSQPQSKSQLQPQLKPQLQPQLQPQPQPQLKPQLQPQLKPQLQPQLQPQLKPQLQPQLKPQLQPQSQSQPKPQVQLQPQPQPQPIEVNVLQGYQDILKDADSPIDNSSKEKMYDQLCAGVFLNHKTKKFWLNKRSNSNCFMLYAKSLTITWGSSPEYWRWLPLEEERGTKIEVAELKRVCWLEVHGRFDTRKLTPGVLYEVSFLIMLKDPAQGWEVPVNVRLVLPGGKTQEHKEILIEKLRVTWIEIPVGQFVASTQDVGEMEFSMYEYEGGNWKQGLVIKGVSIKPNPNYQILCDAKSNLIANELNYSSSGTSLSL